MSRQESQQGSNYSYSSNANDNWQFAGRKLLKPEEVTALSERVAICFTPGVPPIWTTLVRYYERDFKIPRGLGLWKVMFDTACLFLAVSILAVMFTAGLFMDSFN